MPQQVNKPAKRGYDRYAMVSQLQKAQIGYKAVSLPTRAEAIANEKDYIGLILTEVMSDAGIDPKELMGHQRVLLKKLANDMIDKSRQRVEVKLLAAKENGLDFILHAQNDLNELGANIVVIKEEVNAAIRQLDEDKELGKIEMVDYVMQKEEILMRLNAINELYLDNGLKITNSRLLADAAKIQIANIRQEYLKNEIDGIVIPSNAEQMNIPTLDSSEPEIDDSLHNLLD